MKMIFFLVDTHMAIAETSKESFHGLYPTYPQIPWFPYLHDTNDLSRSSSNEVRNPYDSAFEVDKNSQVEKKAKISFSVESIIGRK